MTDNFSTYETAWCPGCGNFSILDCLKAALTELDLRPQDVLLAAGNGADQCVACGLCETHCPQGLKIPELLKTAHQALTETE